MEYDNICKRLAETYPRDFASWLMGQPAAEVEVRKTELSSEPIRADSLILLQLLDTLLHIEFQTTPRSQPPLPLRMLDYWVRLFRTHEMPVTQFVIVLSETTEEIPQEFRAANTWHRYNVIKMWEQPPEPFLSQPGLLPLAALARSDEPRRLLEAVAARVMQVGTPGERAELASCASVLAGLRFDKDFVGSLLREEIMEESVTYQAILQKGVQLGESRGELRGELKGELKTVLRLLKHRFGALSPEVEERIITLGVEDLDDLSIALLDFQQESDLKEWLARRAS
jgi:predicted transposase/invertase (TIGR01784 family)